MYNSRIWQSGWIHTDLERVTDIAPESPICQASNARFGNFFSSNHTEAVFAFYDSDSCRYGAATSVLHNNGGTAGQNHVTDGLIWLWGYPFRLLASDHLARTMDHGLLAIHVPGSVLDVLLDDERRTITIHK